MSDGGDRSYEPQGSMPPGKRITAAAQLFTCHAPEILMDGPAGTGKTRAILEKVNAVAIKYPGARILICRKTRKSMTESALVTLEDKVFPPDAPMRGGPTRAFRSQYVYPNGSELIVGGLDHPERLFSTEFDIVVVFEATEATEDDWEKLHRSLRNNVVPYQQAIADCNPSSSRHWLKLRAEAGKMTRLISTHQDNPVLWDGRTDDWTEEGRRYVEGTLAGLSGVRRERLYRGLWVTAEGMVYENWEPAAHLIDSFAIPKDWRRIRSIDFGFTNPFVCQWWAIDPDGRMYLYREIYYTHRLVEEHAREIDRLSQGEYIEATPADHDAEDRATLDRYGIPTTPALKAVTVGIQAVSNRLTMAGDGKPRLFLMRDALVERDPALARQKKPCCTVEEIEGYLWEEEKEGRAPKEEPRKVDDHGCDAMRYAVMQLDGRTPGMIYVLDTIGETREDRADDKQIEAQMAEEARSAAREQVGVDQWCNVDNDAIWEQL